jgi:signal peptidase I
MSNPAAAPATASWRRALRFLERIFAIVGFLFFVYITCFHLSVISSGSMSPTLHGEDMSSGDVVLAEKVSFWFRKPHRWEVVLFHDELGVQIMKRVVGLPGETVYLKDMKTVLINGQTMPFPPSLQSQRYYSFGLLAPGKMASSGNGYFVLGDDSRDSQDSRFTGPIQWEHIKGRAWLRVWPPSRFGVVNP